METVASNARSQLVCNGELLSGHAPDTVRQTVCARLRLDDAQAAALFSGRRVVIKTGLSDAEARHYVEQFAAMGLRVLAEPVADAPPARPAGPPTPAGETPPPVSRPAATAAMPPGGLAAPGDGQLGGSSVADGAAATPPMIEPESVVCPGCGERQPKRTLCRKCALDMPRFLAAREANEAEARAVEAIAVAPAAPGADGPQRLPVIGLGIDGRVGRIDYVLGSLIVLILLLWFAMLALKVHSWFVIGVGAVFAIVTGWRLMILRCHDCGFSGWWSALSLLPYLGSLFSLLLALIPGSRGNNEHGAEPPRGPVPLLLAALVVLVITAYAGGRQLATTGGQMLASLAGNAASTEASPEEAADALAALAADFDPVANRIVIYRMATCPACDDTADALDALGLSVEEVNVDREPAAREEFGAKLQAAGIDGRFNLPAVEVNGTLLVDDPSFAEISRHLKRRSG